MPVYNDEGIVLRTVKLGEADRIITILTRNNGKVRAVAKGVRREKSRFGARLEPFMRDSLQLYRGRSDLQIVSQAVCIGSYAERITQHYDRYEAASLMAEAADKLIGDEGEPLPSQYLLLVGATSALARGLHEPWQIAQSYLLRSLSQAGWRPQLFSCVTCGRTDPRIRLTSFSIADGGMECAEHETAGSTRITDSGLRLLRALLRGDWEHCPPRFDPTVAGLVENWVRYYLGRPLQAAQLLDSKYEH